MLGIIDRRKRTVSVSGTREQSSKLNRHSVQTKHEKCKSYLVARVSWERYRTRIHGREQNRTEHVTSIVCTLRVCKCARSVESPCVRERVVTVTDQSAHRTDDTTAHARRATSPPDPHQLLFSFIIFACNQQDSLTDSVQCRHARFHLPAADVLQWKIPLQYLRKNLTSANMLLRVEKKKINSKS